MDVVTGTYHDEEKASEAIEELVDVGIPLDQISVIVTDETGDETEVPIMEEPQVMKGAAAGGAIGAALGGLGATLVATGVFAGPGLGVLAAGPVLSIIQGTVGGGAFGYGLGTLTGLGLWKEEADLHEADLENGAALIVVHSDEFREKAREVFQRTGADRIAG